MIISLINGKIIEISIEAYLRMTDEDYEYLISINYGEEIPNPFTNSVLLNGEDDCDEEDIEIIIEDPDSLDKLTDLDVENWDE